MSRKIDDRVKQAEEMFGKGLKLVEIASQLNLPEGTIRSWKNRYKWECNVANNKRSVAKKKKGGQPENKNATGPPGNKNAEKYGFFSKYLPEETVSIIQEMPTDPLDVLWDQIQIAYAAIIRAQKIMYVRDKEDKTIEKIEEKNGNVIGERWEVQQAWDKHGNFLSAQARAHKNWDMATEEQRARIEQIKANTERMRAGNGEEEGDGVTIINDAPTGEDIGYRDTEVSEDIQQ